MASEPITPESLLTEIVAQLNIVIDWATHAKGAAQLGEHAEDLCRHYRAYAICLFAREGDVDVFFQWLLHSPITRRHFLNVGRAEGLTGSEHLRTSFVDPVLDAVAARQWKLAAEIGAMTSPMWMEGVEYEDDFCYGDFLRRMVSRRSEGMGELIERWQAALEGGHDLRLDVAQALLAGQADGLRAAVLALLQDTEAKARRLASPETLSPLADELPFFPNRWISVEGLALLALAEQQGIPLDEDIVFCPRLLRSESYAPFTPLAYPNLGID